MLHAFWYGFILGLSLVVALGPQNLFLIRQGVMRNHALLAMLVCFTCDCILVTTSITFTHAILLLTQGLEKGLKWIGALFLLFYGGRTLMSSFRKKTLTADKEIRYQAWQVIYMATGFSLFNPHAVLDSIIILGGSSSRFPQHWHLFMWGTLCSSLIWFSGLILTTYFFSDFLRKPKIWKNLERLSGSYLLFLSYKLIKS